MSGATDGGVACVVTPCAAAVVTGLTVAGVGSLASFRRRNALIPIQLDSFGRPPVEVGVGLDDGRVVGEG